jgi:deoxyribonucleoside regulator
MSESQEKTPPPKGPRAKRDDALIEAAWLYYHEGLNQSEVAQRMRVSRASVVNYLQDARAAGLIRVTLADEPFTRHRLALDLCARFGLSAAYIVPTASNASATLTRVARGAAEWLKSLLVPGDRLGVAWGQTVFEVSEQMDPVVTQGIDVLQLVGSVPSPFGFTAEACTTNLARKLSATCINLFAPAVLSSAANAAILRAEPIIADQLARLTGINKAIFAAGSCLPDSHVVGSGVATLDDLAAYRASGAEGVLCGRFVDALGAHVKGALDDRIIGVTPDQLLGLDMGLLVSCGSDKVAPMRAVLSGGYATHLVTDMDTARSLTTAPVT